MKKTSCIKIWKVVNVVLDSASVLLFAVAIWLIYILHSVMINPPQASQEGLKEIVNVIDTSHDVEELRTTSQRLFSISQYKNEYFKNQPIPPVKPLIYSYCLVVILKFITGGALYKLKADKNNSNQGMDPTESGS